MKALQSTSVASTDRDYPSDGVFVSFVIPAWNEQSVLADCLASIARLNIPEGIAGYEVIVVDNESTDGTAAVAAAGRARVVTVEPGRASRARNAGASAATGQFLAFVDADCELDADWLAVCAGHLRSPDVVAAGTSLAPPCPDATWVERAWFQIVGGRGTKAQEVSWLASFNLLVRKDAFLKAGAFDESLETCEDCDLGYRLQRFGKLVCDAQAATIHHGESKSLAQLVRREAWRSRGNLWLLKRHGINIRDGKAVAIPLVFLVGLVLSVLGTTVSLLLQAGSLPWVVALAMVLFIPVGILLAKRVIPRRSVQSAQCLVVYGAYLFGRAIGLLLPIRRLQRRAPAATVSKIQQAGSLQGR